MKICQSCAMPMDDEKVMGRNKDGSISEEYCIYCCPKGEFNKPDETLEEMISSCVPYLMKEGHSEAQAKEILTEKLSTLKRWINE